MEHQSSGFRRCGQYDGQPPLGTGTLLECEDNSAIGQYVYIHIPLKEHLTICEAEVFGIGKCDYSDIIF